MSIPRFCSPVKRKMFVWKKMGKNGTKMEQKYDKNMIFFGAIKYHILSYFLIINYDKI